LDDLAWLREVASLPPPEDADAAVAWLRAVRAVLAARGLPLPDMLAVVLALPGVPQQPKLTDEPLSPPGEPVSASAVPLLADPVPPPSAAAETPPPWDGAFDPAGCAESPISDESTFASPHLVETTNLEDGPVAVPGVPVSESSGLPEDSSVFEQPAPEPEQATETVPAHHAAAASEPGPVSPTSPEPAPRRKKRISPPPRRALPVRTPDAEETSPARLALLFVVVTLVVAWLAAQFLLPWLKGLLER